MIDHTVLSYIANIIILHLRPIFKYDLVLMDVSDYCMVDAHDSFLFEGPSCFPLKRQLITIIGFRLSTL